MQFSSAPTPYVYVFAQNTGASYIRTVPQNTSDASDTNAATFEGGFPVPTFTNGNAGGVAPDGRDWQGILHSITFGLQYLLAGGQTTFNAAFSAANNGYPKGARLASVAQPGLIWLNSVDNNTNDPDVTNDSAPGGWHPDFNFMLGHTNNWTAIQVFEGQVVFNAGALTESPSLGDISGLVPNTNWVYDLIMYPTIITLSNANLTLTANQYGCGILVFVGALTNNVVATLPIRPGSWRVLNATTGAYNLTLETNYASSGGLTINPPQGYIGSIYCDTSGNLLFGDTMLLGTPNTWSNENDFYTDPNASIIMKTRPAGDASSAGANTAFVTRGLETQSSGRLLSDLIYDASRTYTFLSLAELAFVEIGGGGGGGGGCAAAATGQSSASSGGGGGAVLRIVMQAPAGETLANLIPAGFNLTIGAAGMGTSAGAYSGGAGGDTVLTIAGLTYTARGGSGGNGGTSVIGPSAGGGGEGGPVNFYSEQIVNGVTIYIYESSNGGVGGLSFVFSPGNSSAGYGGANGMGKPGALTTPTGSPGNAATNFGGGGAGANAIAGGGAQPGGPGALGYIRFTQYSV